MTKHIMDNAIVKLTKKKYSSIERKWLKYCRDKDMDPMEQGTVVFLNFFLFLLKIKPIGAT